jgi:hypothetical protein
MRARDDSAKTGYHTELLACVAKYGHVGDIVVATVSGDAARGVIRAISSRR